MSKYLIAGLGNMGAEYEGTRHNIGFEIADALVKDCAGTFSSGRHAHVAEVKYKGRQLVVIKPTTYMNLSGKAIAYWLQQEGIPPERLLVMVDEIALPFGKIRLGPKGSDGGHNGLRNIQEILATTVYPRLRFGIGNTYSKGRQVDYVLGSWSDEEKETLSARIQLAADAVKAFTFSGLERAMNEYNNK